MHELSGCCAPLTDDDGEPGGWARKRVSSVESKVDEAGKLYVCSKSRVRVCANLFLRTARKERAVMSVGQKVHWARRTYK